MIDFRQGCAKNTRAFQLVKPRCGFNEKVEKIVMSGFTRVKAVLAVLALTGGALAMTDDLPFKAELLQHWAYQKVQKPAVPAVKNHSWVKTPVDAFILQKLEAQSLAHLIRHYAALVEAQD